MRKAIKCYRLITFAPPEAAENLAEKISALIPPLTPEYDCVAWWSEPGTEQFRPLPGAQSTEGKIGEICRAPSVRLEFSLPADDELLHTIIAQALRPNHPWEKPVILVYEHFLV